jgi:hypothetical protein
MSTLVPYNGMGYGRFSRKAPQKLYINVKQKLRVHIIPGEFIFIFLHLSRQAVMWGLAGG